MSSKDEIHQKMSEYSSFIHDVLRPELDAAKKRSHKVKTEIQEYTDLKEQLEILRRERPECFESIVDLGYKTVYCRAVSKEPRKVFVHVGLGFQIELSITEALAFLNKRVSFLERDVLSEKEKKVTEVKDHIASAGLILDQLERELQRN